MNVFKPKNKCLARFYNWSSYYALAVIELGQAIKANRALNTSEIPQHGESHARFIGQKNPGHSSQ